MTLSKKPERDCDSMEVRLYNRGWNAAIDAITSPPAQRTWVGLTDKDYQELHLQMGPTYFYQDYGKAIEAKLKEKNT